jgi:hypothetical protein
MTSPIPTNNVSGTPELEASIANGGGVSHEDVLREFGL